MGIILACFHPKVKHFIYFSFSLCYEYLLLSVFITYLNFCSECKMEMLRAKKVHTILSGKARGLWEWRVRVTVQCVCLGWTFAALPVQSLSP